MSATSILPGSTGVGNRSGARRRGGASIESAAFSRELAQYYEALRAAYGAQHWWPGRTRLEVVVGAILTQSTSWRNVELAIAKLRRKRVLSVRALERVSVARLANLIRSSGYFRQKARKVKAFVTFLRERYGGSLDRMFAAPTGELRQKLLEVHGIGPETADSILLYAGKHAVFVVDAYTRRILERHKLASAKASYHEIQQLFEKNLPGDAAMFNEYHALIVETGKLYCRKREARCAECPLRLFLPAEAEVRG